MTPCIFTGARAEEVGLVLVIAALNALMTVVP